MTRAQPQDDDDEEEDVDAQVTQPTAEELNAEEVAAEESDADEEDDAPVIVPHIAPVDKSTPYSRTNEFIRDKVQGQVNNVFNGAVDALDADKWTSDYVKRVAITMARVVQSAQIVMGNLTATDLARKFGDRRPTLADPDRITMRDNGIPKDLEYSRPMWEVSKAMQNGATPGMAMEKGLRRLSVLTDVDLQMAKVRQAQISLKAAGRKTYRRQTTSDNPCALCEIAEDQIYYTDDLMPIHDGCMCDIVPDDSNGDQSVVDADFQQPDTDRDIEQKKAIDELNDDPDSTPKDYRDLIAVRQHGEIGPILTWKSQHFAGPEDLPDGARKFYKTDRDGNRQELTIDQVNWRNEQAREGYRRRAADKRDLRGAPEPHYALGHNVESPYRFKPSEDFSQTVLGNVTGENTGVTIDLAGREPTEGYAYAPLKGTEEIVSQQDITLDDIDKYIDDHYAELAQEGNNLGLWVEDGNVYMDVSRVGDASAETIATAQGAKQLAVFDLKTFKQIDIGKLDSDGRYVRLGKATDLHYQYQEQIQRDLEKASKASVSEIPTGAQEELDRLRLLAQNMARTLGADNPAAKAAIAAYKNRLDALTLDAGRVTPGPIPYYGGNNFAVEQQLVARHPGLDVDFTGRMLDTDAIHSAAVAVDDMMTKYPMVGLRRVTANSPLSTTTRLAEVDVFRGQKPEIWTQTEMRLQPKDFGDNSKLALDYRSSIDAGYHPSIDGYNPAYAIVVHEFGHSLDAAGGYQASANAVNTISNTFLRLHPQPKDGAPAYAKYKAWKDAQFSNYSFGEKTLQINPSEAVAEAFAHVELDPANATEGERALHDLLVDSAQHRHPTLTGPGWQFAALEAPSETVARKETARAVAKRLEGQQAAIRLAQPQTGKGFATPKGAQKFGSVLDRIPQGRTVDPIYKIKLDGTPQLVKGKPVLDKQKTWDSITDEELRENWRQALRQSDKWAWDSGAAWYGDLNTFSANLAEVYGDQFKAKYGIELTRDLVAGMMSSYSTNNSWAGNLLGVQHLLNGTANQVDKFGKDLGAPVAMHFQNPDWGVKPLLEYLRSGKGSVSDYYAQNLSAPKPYNFLRSIQGHDDAATADRWVARIMLHTNNYDFADEMWAADNTTGRYGFERMRQAIVDVSKEDEFAGFKAYQLQAIPWVMVNGPDAAAASMDVSALSEAAKAEKPVVAVTEELRRIATEKGWTQAADAGVVWKGPPVAEPVGQRSKFADQIEYHWHGTDFDTYKTGIRQGARDAQQSGYKGLLGEHVKGRKLPPYNLEGREIVARAVHSAPTTETLYRGMRIAPQDLPAFSTAGTEISLPLSSFTPHERVAAGFGGDKRVPGWDEWESFDVPKDYEGIVLKLEPGAKVAPLREVMGSTPESIAFGKFEIVKVEPGEYLPNQRYGPFSMNEKTGKYDVPMGVGVHTPTVVTVRQTSMIEDAS